MNIFNLEHKLIYASSQKIQHCLFLILCPFNFSIFLQENSRLENELLENAEKLAEYENLTNKLQRNLENLLAEKVNLFKFDLLTRSPKCSLLKSAEATPPRKFLLEKYFDGSRRPLVWQGYNFRAWIRGKILPSAET